MHMLSLAICAIALQEFNLFYDHGLFYDQAYQALNRAPRNKLH